MEVRAALGNKDSVENHHKSQEVCNADGLFYWWDSFDVHFFPDGFFPYTIIRTGYIFRQCLTRGHLISNYVTSQPE